VRRARRARSGVALVCALVLCVGFGSSGLGSGASGATTVAHVTAPQRSVPTLPVAASPLLTLSSATAMSAMSVAAPSNSAVWPVAVKAKPRVQKHVGAKSAAGKPIARVIASATVPTIPDDDNPYSSLVVGR